MNLQKRSEGPLWSEFILGDRRGEYLFSDEQKSQLQQRLSYLTAEDLVSIAFLFFLVWFYHMFTIYFDFIEFKPREGQTPLQRSGAGGLWHVSRGQLNARALRWGHFEAHTCGKTVDVDAWEGEVGGAEQTGCHL